MNHRSARGRSSFVVVAAALVLAASSAVSAQQDSAVVFGVGGSFAGVLAAGDGMWTEQLESAGLPPAPGLWVLSGGSGRGGTVGGWSFGGVGWETSARMASVDGLASANIDAAVGGLDIGAVFAGSVRSFLTAGAVIGGGSAALTVKLAGDPAEAVPNGIEVEPIEFSSATAFLSVAPYLSMQVQPLRFLGFELRFGYLFELASVQWLDESALIELPDLRFEGPWVSLGVSWGWVGRRRAAVRTIEWEEPVSVPISGGALVVDNAIGDVVIHFVTDSGVDQSGSQRTVLGTATVRAPAGMSDAFEIQTFADDDRTVIRSETPVRAGGWRVDYDLVVPTGTPLELDLGIGDVRIDVLDARSDFRVGVGDVVIGTASGTSLVVSVGVGSVTVGELRSPQSSVAVETGAVDVRFAAGASVGITASVGLGNIDIADFADTPTATQGTIGRDLQATIGDRPAEQQLTIRVGVGGILLGESNEGDSVDPD